MDNLCTWYITGSLESDQRKFADMCQFKSLIINGYHLVNQHSYGKSPFGIGKSTINKWPCSMANKLPEG